MKKIIFFGFLLFFGYNGFSGGLKAYLSLAAFNTPDNNSYIETYLTIDGNSVKYVKDSSGVLHAKLDIQIMFMIDDSIVNFNKYELYSPARKDTLSPALNFLDVQRYSLSHNVYTLKLTIKDANTNEKSFDVVTKVSTEYNTDTVCFSDIEPVSEYKKSDKETILEKNGYTLMPYVFNYYPESTDTFSFYAEIYGADKVLDENDYILYTYIRPYEIDRKLDNYFQLKRMKPAPITPILKSFDISDLPTGNYLLVLEARDKNNEVIATKQYFFQRYNPSVEFNLTSLLAYSAEKTFAGEINNKDTLIQYISYTFPISTDFEKKYAKSIIKQGDIETLKKYFLNFWITRDKTNPEKAWNDYKALVDYANKKFKSISAEGYQTDRGRIFLQYGQPDVVSQRYNEPAAYPYEIWQYYKLKNGQTNKKFVFYSRDLVTNDFVLIHSDAIGELSNYQWQYIVYKRVLSPLNITDKVNQPDAWGNKAANYYYQPR
jgi:GWxTD domain-containing protein